MVVGTALTWTGWIESGLVTVASVIATFGPNLLTGVTMRAAMLVPTCCLLVMFVTVGSLPGIALETFVLASSLVGIGRLLAGPRISPGRAA
jgi:hypothetical protein